MINVKVVTLKGCPHCEIVRNILKKLKPEYDLTVEEIDVESQKGQEYVKKYSLTGAPAIFINDELYRQGEASEKEFREKFDSLN